MIPLKDDTPVERTPVVTYALVATNVAAFAWQLGVGLDVSAFRGGAIPYEILTLSDIDLPALVPPPLTIVSSMFLHGGFVHAASNLLFLWIFGDDVEDALGRRRFAGFYLAAGIAAALAQTVAAAASGDLLVPMVGASGAIAGVLAAYVTLFPRARVLSLVVVFLYVRLVPVPAAIFIGLWFALQVASVIFGGEPGVAFFAHIGGFVAGLILVRAVGRRPAWRARRVPW